jgi:hypothetical protein
LHDLVVDHGFLLAQFLAFRLLDWIQLIFAHGVLLNFKMTQALGMA